MLLVGWVRSLANVLSVESMDHLVLRSSLCPYGCLRSLASGPCVCYFLGLFAYLFDYYSPICLLTDFTLTGKATLTDNFS